MENTLPTKMQSSSCTRFQLASFARLILLSSLLILTTEQARLSHRFCSYRYHFSKDVQDCVLCTDKCPRGFGLNINCGYDIYGNRLGPGCSRCPDGYYSRNGKGKTKDIVPALLCRRCKQCYPPLKPVRKCSAKKNAKCSACPKGMYKHRDGRCYKCSYCCDGMIEADIGVVSSCIRSGMGRCSCRAYTVCHDRNANAQCYAYRNQTLQQF